MLDWLNNLSDQQVATILVLSGLCAAAGCFKGARFCYQNDAGNVAFWLGMTGVATCVGLCIWGLSYFV